MNITPRIKIALIIGGCVLLVAAAAFGFIYPQVVKSSRLTEKGIAGEGDLLEARTLLASRTSLAAKSDKIKAELKAQEAKVPQDAEISTVLRTIQDMAHENNHWLFEITNDTPETTEETFYNTWESKITVEGSWLDTVSFLRKLRDMDRQVRVTNVDFTRLTDIRGGATVANRVLKHWDPEAYPVRAVITCDFYFIPKASVEESMKVLKKDVNTEGEAETAEGGAAK